MVADFYKHLLCMLYEYYCIYFSYIQWDYLFNTWKPWGSEKAEKRAQGLNPGVSGAKARL